MSSPDPQWIGIWLLVVSVVVIMLEGLVAAIWSLRLSRKARALSELMVSQQAALNADVERLRASIAEMHELWQPYGRLLRLLRHPITIALMQSFVRRGAAAR